MPVDQGQKGVAQDMRRFKEGTLHSGSKSGPIVKNRKQAIAISMSEAGLSKKGPVTNSNRNATSSSFKSGNSSKSIRGGGGRDLY